jgi:hypothetical protein
MLRPPSRPTSRAGGRDVWGSSSRLRARSRRALALSLPSSCLDRKRAAGTPQDTRGAVMCTVVLLGAMPRATLPSRGRRAETPCPSIARCRSTTQISPPSSPRARGRRTRRSFQRDDECPYADHEAGPEAVRSQLRNALTLMTTLTPVIRLSDIASFASHLAARSGPARLRPLEVGQRVDRLLRRSARRISRGD